MRRAVVLLLAFCCSGGTCGNTGPSSPAQLPRYEDSFLEAKCEANADAQPLLVDMQPEARVDYEVAMREAIAVVAYDCKTLRLLKGCRVEGTYGFVGTVTKQQTVAITNKTELAWNIPSVQKRVEAEIDQGSRLDVHLAMIGKRMSTRRRVGQQELTGECTGATHIVTGATVGAFALQTMKKDGPAPTFSLSANAGAVQPSNVLNRDGDLASCQSAKPDDKHAPKQCDALLRLDLSPLTGASAASALAPSCPLPLVWNGSLCVKTLEKHVCRLGDAADCQTQCKAKDARSCTTLGVMELEGKGTEKNYEHAFMHFYEACSMADATACSNLGIMTEDGMATKADSAKAAKLFTDACKDGEPAACTNLGELYAKGAGVAQDDRRAAAYYERSCSGGNPAGCSQLGAAYTKGKGVPQDKKLAAQLFQRACDGDWARGCTNAAALAVDAKDPSRALQLFQKGCSGGDDVACTQLKKIDDPKPPSSAH